MVVPDRPGARWLWQSDVLLVTSQQEYFGVSVVEAMHCGCYPLLPLPAVSGWFLFYQCWSPGEGSWPGGHHPRAGISSFLKPLNGPKWCVGGVGGVWVRGCQPTQVGWCGWRCGCQPPPSCNQPLGSRTCQHFPRVLRFPCRNSSFLFWIPEVTPPKNVCQRLSVVVVVVVFECVCVHMCA